MTRGPARFAAVAPPSSRRFCPARSAQPARARGCVEAAGAAGAESASLRAGPNECIGHTHFTKIDGRGAGRSLGGEGGRSTALWHP